MFTVTDLSGSHPFEPSNRTVRLAVYCLIVNAPQLIVSICYFAFSSLYSRLFQAKYWADFSIKPQLLRVSFRHGDQQESTPALQFPWAWGLSFILIKAAIGWSLTQSFYLLLIAGEQFTISCLVKRYSVSSLNMRFDNPLTHGPN